MTDNNKTHIEVLDVYNIANNGKDVLIRLSHEQQKQMIEFAILLSRDLLKS